MSEHLVWWLNQNAAEEVSENESTMEALPEYIRDEVNSCYGRAGRGRLWIHSSLKANSMDLSGQEPLYEAISECAGIVINPEDAVALRALPGFVTDYKLEAV